MHHFLALQNTYHTIELGLYSGSTCLEKVSVDKTQASKEIVSLFAQLLTNHNLKLTDMAFMAVNQGPGPFTTLRVVIATANGLAFASGIPLVGVDGLDAHLLEHAASSMPVVALLNAFGCDVYYGIFDPATHSLEKGYQSVDPFWVSLRSKLNGKEFLCVGNGSVLYQDKIAQEFKSQAHIITDRSQTAALEYVARQGLTQWNNKENVQSQLFPLYLKQTTW